MTIIFTDWYLTLSPNKSVAIAFHLNNKEGNRRLKVNIEDTVIPKSEALGYYMKPHNIC